MEYLLVEPEYDDIFDSLLDLKTYTLSVSESYFKDYSALDYVDYSNSLMYLSYVNQMRVKEILIVVH